LVVQSVQVLEKGLSGKLIEGTLYVQKNLDSPTTRKELNIGGTLLRRSALILHQAADFIAMGSNPTDGITCGTQGKECILGPLLKGGTNRQLQFFCESS